MVAFTIWHNHLCRDFRQEALRLCHRLIRQRCLHRDDLLIYGVGRTDDEATRDHDLKLENLLQRCREIGTSLNVSKMSLRQKSVSFPGHAITQGGLQPDPAKIGAIRAMPTPTDVTGAQTHNEVVNYLATFLPMLSDVMEPIRQLARKNVPWNVSKREERALEKMTILVSEAPVLCYYEHAKAITVQCDASQTGLAILQDGQPLAFASRELTDTGARYSQIEKEMLAVVWSLAKIQPIYLRPEGERRFRPQTS